MGLIYKLFFGNPLQTSPYFGFRLGDTKIGMFAPPCNLELFLVGFLVVIFQTTSHTAQVTDNYLQQIQIYLLTVMLKQVLILFLRTSRAKVLESKFPFFFQCIPSSQRKIAFLSSMVYWFPLKSGVKLHGINPGLIEFSII